MKAQEMKIRVQLQDKYQTLPFVNAAQNDYQRFCSSQKVQIMMALFKTEFDIGTLMKAGIISNHYMSHQNRRYAIMKSFRAKGVNLMLQFIGTKYVPHLEPLSLIADYYGEK